MYVFLFIIMQLWCVCMSVCMCRRYNIIIKRIGKVCAQQTRLVRQTLQLPGIMN